VAVRDVTLVGDSEDVSSSSPGPTGTLGAGTQAMSARSASSQVLVRLSYTGALHEAMPSALAFELLGASFHDRSGTRQRHAGLAGLPREPLLIPGVRPGGLAEAWDGVAGAVDLVGPTVAPARLLDAARVVPVEAEGAPSDAVEQLGRDAGINVGGRLAPLHCALRAA